MGEIMVNDNQKECFVISPIGDAGSETRERSDLILDHIITPAVRPFGYTPVRADNIDHPGLITSQVIQYVLDAPLVIADLTGQNPNVFYELAIRHVTGKPFIQIIQDGEQIPFDVGPMRTIPFTHTHLGRAADAIEKIKAQIESLEQNPLDVETPITTSVDLQRLRSSEVPQERSLAELLAIIGEIRSDLSYVTDRISTSTETVDNRMIQMISDRLSEKMDNILNVVQSNRTSGRNVARENNILRRIIAQYSGSYGFLIAVSTFRDRTPWLYELGMEVHRVTIAEDYNLSQKIFEDMLQVLDISDHLLPDRFAVTSDDLNVLYHDMVQRVKFSDLPF